ncbi:MAG: hypothetical protein AAGE88_18350 [Actinomycetota bacterium]
MNFNQFAHLDPDALEATTNLGADVLESIFATGNAVRANELLGQADPLIVGATVSLLLGMLVAAIDEQAAAMGVAPQAFIDQWRDQNARAVAAARSKRN